MVRDMPSTPAPAGGAEPIPAAGGVLWRGSRGAKGESKVEIAVIHRPRYDDWSLPKGKLARRESALAGAIREVREETGFKVRVGPSLGETGYLKVLAGAERPKVVSWWAMRAKTGEVVPGREVDELRYRWNTRW